jgi:hypothetical protein
MIDDSLQESNEVAGVGDATEVDLAQSSQTAAADGGVAALFHDGHEAGDDAGAERESRGRVDRKRHGIAVARGEAAADRRLCSVDFEVFLAKPSEVVELRLEAVGQDSRLVAPRCDPDPDAEEEDLGGDVGDAVLVGARAGFEGGHPRQECEVGGFDALDERVVEFDCAQGCTDEAVLLVFTEVIHVSCL